ncbi:hypothetical protein MA16_Dca007315 [Dendrobium catenatum]|uniref:Uncharacterized protein n=1 Tax=Dendrobium catenatum TaxID=906689 RepID=A0A2I0W6M4_9ASPA|nr:hypothetical protein MA16_Dca007315 [Dendrobium catenatum]
MDGDDHVVAVIFTREIYLCNDRTQNVVWRSIRMRNISNTKYICDVVHFDWPLNN